MKKITLLKFLIFIVIILLIYIIFKNPCEKIYKINIIKTIDDNILVEDFNSKLDEKHWNIVERRYNYNNELQYYNPSNVSVKDDFLVVEAKKEELNNHEYTSGLIDTKGKFEFLYGKIIFRVRTAVGKGLVSAIWLLPADGSSFPEIDIMEALGSENNRVWTGVHHLNTDFILISDFVNYIGNKDFSIYQLDWEENEIRCYVDNKLVFKTNTGIPNKKMYLIINLSVGGDWVGNPNDSVFPTSFLLDYIMIIPKESDVT